MQQNHETRNVRNIGIFAHVDAGKTTLTEQILYQTGAIRAAGRVDHGTAHTDSLAVERRRGISVRAQATCTVFEDTEIRIIDTPGHADFIAEVEGALLALDGAVLVISAVEGVQAQTAVIYRALRSLNLPVIAFINKMDRSGADAERTLAQLAELTGGALDTRLSAGALCDALSRADETLLERMLEHETPPSSDEIDAAIGRCAASGALIPTVYGVALRGEGVGDILKGIVRWLPAPEGADDLSCVAYRVERQKSVRSVHVRMYGGALGFTLGDGARAKRILRLTPKGFVPVSSLSCGDIGILEGAETLSRGAWLGGRARGDAILTTPALRAEVVPENEADRLRLPEVLRTMADAQPSLAPEFAARTRSFFVHIAGVVHQEIMEESLREDYALPARLSKPTVLYRETPLCLVEGRVDTFRSPWFSRTAFRIEPLPLGNGVVYESKVSTDLIYARYQNEIREAALAALGEGLHGWPVTDLCITFIDGQSLRISHPGSSFAPVVPLALFDALSAAGTRLLEPIDSFEAWLDADTVGTFLYDLHTMRATWEEPVNRGGSASIRGVVPLETSMQYVARFQALTRGRGVWRTAHAGWAPCPEGCGRDIPRTTPDPLDHGAYFTYLKGLLDAGGLRD